MFQVRKISYNLRNFQKIANSNKNSVKIALQTISYRTPQLWNLVPTEIKDAPSLSIFKEKIKSWYCDDLFHFIYLFIYLFTSFNVVYRIVENNSSNKYQQNQIKI